MVFGALLWMCAVLCTAYTIPLSEFYPYGSSEGDSILGRNDDNGVRITLEHIFPYFGENYTEFYVSLIYYTLYTTL